MARRQVENFGVVIEGLPQLRRAFEQIEGRGNFGVGYEVTHRLRNIGEHVAQAAPGFVTHKTGRHGDPSLPRLETTVRVSVTANRASVYTDSPYGRVQQYGGGPRAGWGARGPHVQRQNASKWLSRAVASERGYVEEQTDAVLDWIVTEWNR